MKSEEKTLEMVTPEGVSPGCEHLRRSCPDCHFCQLCSDNRCQICRRSKTRKARKAFADQIAEYNSMNKDLVG